MRHLLIWLPIYWYLERRNTKWHGLQRYWNALCYIGRHITLPRLYLMSMMDQKNLAYIVKVDILNSMEYALGTFGEDGECYDPSWFSECDRNVQNGLCLYQKLMGRQAALLVWEQVIAMDKRHDMYTTDKPANPA